MKNNFVATNSADPDEMPHFAAFHRGLHCLQKYPSLSHCASVLSLKNNFVATNSADPDEMPLFAAFHRGLHCLQKYPFKCSTLQRPKDDHSCSNSFLEVISPCMLKEP